MSFERAVRHKERSAGQHFLVTNFFWSGRFDDDELASVYELVF